MHFPRRKEATKLKNKQQSFGKRLFDGLFENKVTLLFVLLVIGAVIVSGNSVSFVISEVFNRFGRNAFTVLSLLIPVLAGMGLNFSIVIGAIAAQISLFFVVYWNLSGMTGMLVAFAITTPLAMLFGMLVGRLFNQMKGAEMIAGLILGYFADGLYQLLFLFILGGVIPIHSERLMIPGGIGVKNTIDLTDNVKYSLDNVLMIDLLTFTAIVLGIMLIYKAIKNYKDTKKFPTRQVIGMVIVGVLYGITYIPFIERQLMNDRLMLLHAIFIGVIGMILYGAINLIKRRKSEDPTLYKSKSYYWGMIIGAVVLYALTYVPYIEKLTMMIRLPVLPFVMIFGLCVFNRVFLSTRLGQNMRTVGQSQTVANASGLDVDRIRVIAMMISTVLAGWGQLIYLQNLGTFATYGAHLQVGQFAIAALLVGGASVQKATNKQAITGVILFHTLFIVAPEAGKVLFDNAMIGEYFRVFVSYGVIAVALAMHAWQRSHDGTGVEKTEEEEETKLPAEQTT